MFSVFIYSALLQVVDRMAHLVLAYFIAIGLLVNGQSEDSYKSDSQSFRSKDRNARALAFPINSAIGYVVALAIPLDLPRRNVFYSYNFEANYNEPSLGKDFIPGPLERLDLFINGDEDRSFKCNSNDTCTGSTPKTVHRKKKRKHRPKQQRSINQTIFSRKSIYKGLMAKLESAGYKGRGCLLRTICEINQDTIVSNNGVLGSIMHIIFSPSSSKKEHLHDDFYRAEHNGLYGNCLKYQEICKESVLDLISTII